MQAMERRCTALADQQGKLAAEKEKLFSEKQALTEVIAADLQTRVSHLVPPKDDLSISIGINLPVSIEEGQGFSCAGPESLQGGEHQNAGRFLREGLPAAKEGSRGL